MSTTEYLLELGVFDDGDKVPTVVVTTFRAGGPFKWRRTLRTVAAVIPDLREAAEIEYGRKFPPHAEFWSCSAHEVKQ